METWHARRFESVMNNGRTRPLIIDCERGAGAQLARQRFVVKARGLPEVEDFTLCHECVGAAIAAIMGVSAPKTVLVELSPEFIDSTAPSLAHAGLAVHSGFAIGSEYLPGLAPMPRSAELKAEHINLAATIYAFDMTVQNPDRKPSNPNCGYVEERLVAFDFESAFSFRYLIGPKPDPWRVTQLGLSENHVFYKALCGSVQDWNAVVKPIAEVNNAFFEQIGGAVPASWKTVVDTISEHFGVLNGHCGELVDELAASLT